MGHTIDSGMLIAGTKPDGLRIKQEKPLQNSDSLSRYIAMFIVQCH